MVSLEGLPLESAELEEVGVEVDCCCCCIIPPTPLVPVGKNIVEGVGDTVVIAMSVGQGETQPDEDEVEVGKRFGLPVGNGVRDKEDEAVELAVDCSNPPPPPIPEDGV